ncbi:alpha-2-macroglobulin family protein [Gimesia aquarii]|uniref:MG2 domain protein n=1 Tax=Gimesia aquarii TaxID=2527964 RepID=A0A517VVL0_9PLAN|nr:MG2 domain-containing protein [Gimesia aquarii]QDT97044.1 MG2 domain protein [Gimesia aquarii]
MFLLRMKKSAQWSFILLFSSVLGVYLFAAEKKISDERALAQTFQKQGKYRDAYQIYQKLATRRNNTGLGITNDLLGGIQCLKRLNRVNEIDEFRKSILKVHSDKPRVLWKIAESLIHGPHYGYIVDREFIRGNHRGAAQYINTQEQDRLRALQLMTQAVDQLKNSDGTVLARDIYYDFAMYFMNGRQGGNAWKLQILTDLNKVPDYLDVSENSGRFYRGYLGEGPQGAPVDAAGNPIFYRVPQSYETAANDGERWRWMLNRVVLLGPTRRQDASFQIANFYHSQFGVQTLQSYMGYFSRINLDQSEAENEQVNPFSLESLKETETLTRLATGIKRINLPDDVNFIRLYQKIVEMGKSIFAENALSQLASIFENRRQYPTAVKYIQESIQKYGDPYKHKQKRLDQIINNWGQFEPIGTQAAGSGAKVGFRFRNAEQIQFEAYEVHVEKLLNDVKDYLKTHPKQLNWNAINISNLGYRLVREQQKKYQGKLVSQWELDLDPLSGHRDRLITINTPLQNAGAYLLIGKMKNGNTSRIIVWLDDTAIIHKKLAGRTYYYVADSRTGKPIPDANLEFFGYWQKHTGRNQYQMLTSNFAEQTDENGQAFPDATLLKTKYQWITIARTKSGRFAYSGFERFWYSRSVNEKYPQRPKVYGITDRPVYRPGQTVNYKFWLRRVGYDLKDTTEFADYKLSIKLRDNKGKTIFEKTLTTDTFGGVNSDWEIPKDAGLGVYYLQLRAEYLASQGASRKSTVRSNISFRIEEYKKPEFEVLVEAPKEPVALGDTITAKINAKYYFGSPVTKGQVKYKVTRTAYEQRWYPFSRWDWLYGTGYWWFVSDYHWYPGWGIWGCRAPGPWWIPHRSAPPELVLSNTVDIGPDGKVDIKIETALAKAIHGDQDHKYEITAEVVDESRRTIVGKGTVLVSRKPFKVFAWMNRGYYQVGDTMTASFKAQTLDSKPVTGKGKVILYRVTYDDQGTPKETAVQDWELNPADDGTANQKMSATQTGQYRVVYTVTDKAGNKIEGGYLFSIRGEGFDGKEYRFNDLEIVVEKKTYRPNEKVRILINTNQADSTVLLFLRPVNGIYSKPHVLKIAGKSTEYELDVSKSDMPNIFVEAVTIHQGRVHTVARQIAVPPEKRVINVEVEPSEKEYLPGQDAQIKLKVTDTEGQPIEGSLVVSMYDKSVEYISGGSNVPNIKDAFWKWKRSHHPLTYSSLNKTFRNLLRPKEIPMRVIGTFGHLVGESKDKAQKIDGFFGARNGRGNLSKSITRLGSAIQSRMPSSNAAMEMAEAESAGAFAKVSAVVEPVVRQNFADTAYWNGHITTDAEGRAEISLKMPENLTSWKIRSWAMGQGTRVGEGEDLVVTRKNLILRLQAPRFFTETDEVVLSANVHNYLKTSKQVKVVLELDGDTLQPLNGAAQTVEIPANGEKRIDWRVKAVRPGFAVIRMKALTDEESDAMQMTFPVKVHGILKTESYTGSIPADAKSAQISFQIPSQRKSELSRLELRYSPSLAGAMVDALPYLIYSPHKTTDTTLYRFLPTVITQNILKRMGLNLKQIEEKRTNLNAQETGEDKKRSAQWKRYDQNPVFSEAKVSQIVKQGVADLTSMQLADGGWGWFSGWQERSSPYFTVRVVQGLSLAKQNGVALVPGTLERGIDWLKQYQAKEVQKLLNAPSKTKPYKLTASNLDAYIFMVLVNQKVVNEKMYDFLYRDRTKLSVYALGMLGLASEELNRQDRLQMIVENMDQYLVQDEENQTAYLNLPESNYWWYWYGSEVEANAYYLKLLSKTDPKNPKAAQLVKYLLNNRKHSTYWNSVSDTAIAIEALAEFWSASGENQPDLTLEIYLDGQKQKEVTITAENLFTFGNKLVVEGDALSAGAHRLEIRKTGSSPLYYNAYVTNFTKENFITEAGLEIKVQRKYYQLIPEKASTKVSGSRGQAVDQKVEKYQRKLIDSETALKSGDLVEVELVLESKNDYEYLVFEDYKVAGFEPVGVRSGYAGIGLKAYREYRDDRVVFYVRRLARGKHSLNYRLRAEIPGLFSGLPTQGYGMYAPELKANSDEIKVKISD